MVIVRLSVGLLLIAVLIYAAGTGDIARVLGDVLPSWLAAAAGLITLSTCIGAFSVHLLINRDGQMPLRTFLAVYWIGWAVNLTVPGQIGDMAAISSLLRRHGIPWHTSLGRALVDKSTSVAVMLAMGLAGLVMIVRPYYATVLRIDWRLFVSIVIIAAVLVTVLLRALRTSRRGRHLYQFATRIFAEIKATCSAVPERVGANLLLTVAKVALTGLSYWCAFRAYGQSPHPLAVVLLAATSSLVAYLPISLNGLGTVEIAGVALFGTLGLPPGVVLSAYLSLRMLVLAIAWLPASVWLITLRARPLAN